MKSYMITALLLLIALLVSACDNGQSTEKAPAAPAVHPASVSVMSVSLQDIPVSYEFVGQVAGSREVEIRSRISGIVEQRLYEEGQAVDANEVLFVIEQAPFKASMAQAEASLASATAQVASAKAQLGQADRELRRLIPLSKKKLVSQSEVDNARSTVDINRAQLLVAEAAVKQAEANVATAKIDLDYTIIRSPISGIAGRALQTEGALAEPSGTNSLLTTLVQLDPAYINFGVAELEWIRMRSDIKHQRLIFEDKQFSVDLFSEAGEELYKDGKLDFQDYKVDPSTGNFAMRATVKNSNRDLSPGQFVRVRLTGASRPDAVVVPQRAVLDGPGGKYVYVVADGEGGAKIAAQKNVEVGEWVKLDGDVRNAWIIKEGLNAGDQVIVDGSARIFFPGMPVVPQTDAAGKDAQASAESTAAKPSEHKE